MRLSWSEPIVTEEWSEKLAGRGYEEHHPKAEVLGSDGLSSVTDVYGAKQKGLLALVASMPLLAGLIAALVMNLRSQEIRRQAAPIIATLVEPVCVGKEVVLQVGIRGERFVGRIWAEDLGKDEKVWFGEYVGNYQVQAIKTGVSVVEESRVVFYGESGEKLTEDEYGSIDCR